LWYDIREEFVLGVLSHCLLCGLAIVSGNEEWGIEVAECGVGNEEKACYGEEEYSSY